MSERLHNPTSKLLAFLVHSFTSCGVLTGFLSLRAIHLHQWKEAMLWLLVGLFIDGVDGSLARRFKVKEVLPNWDGKSIDFVVDFVNYAFIPAFFFYEAEMVGPQFLLPLTCAILLVSALYYGRSGMVTEDNYFVGFPVLWNGAIFYLYFVLQLGSIWNGVIVSILCVLHFVPIKYIYPSQKSPYQRINILATVCFFVSNGIILYLFPEAPIWLALLSAVCVLFMWGIGIYSTYQDAAA